MLDFLRFWSRRRVVVTGHSGFKGAWLTLWLRRLGAEVTGISLPPEQEPNLFSLAGVAEDVSHYFIDVRDRDALSMAVRRSDPEVVFHLAAQPLVRASYDDPVGTFAVNVLGTAHLLEALRGCPSVRAVVVVTTDKVYRNNEWPYPYREEDALGGHDPYSASKAAAELVSTCYRDSFLAGQGTALATARAGNVIGGGDWAQDRLLPDAVRAWLAGRPLHIRRPMAIRPWQHVLEPLSGYLELARRLWYEPALSGAYNFGPHTSDAATVRTVIDLARRDLPEAEVVWGSGDDGPHEAGWLALETAKARTVLGIRPSLSLNEAVSRTMGWYVRQHHGEDAKKLCLAEIESYEGLLTRHERSLSFN